jgi:hypothetical protein
VEKYIRITSSSLFFFFITLSPKVQSDKVPTPDQHSNCQQPQLQDNNSKQQLTSYNKSYRQFWLGNFKPTTSRGLSPTNQSSTPRDFHPPTTNQQWIPTTTQQLTLAWLSAKSEDPTTPKKNKTPSHPSTTTHHGQPN